ncbi:MAG: hypothetical protein KKE50_05170 [Nanoarchaeota archaeon]|nr:hypothetical protein [Nanoarchaeota archaeon]
MKRGLGMNDIVDLMFGRDRIMDWKREYRDKFCREREKAMGFGERIEDGIVKLIDCCFYMGYSLYDYFA